MVAGPEVRFLSRTDIEALDVPIQSVARDLRGALIAKAEGPGGEYPPKAAVHPRPGTALHAALAYASGLDACGIKWLARYADNPARAGLPACSGLYVLNATETGHPLAIMEASWITEIRTAVVTALTLQALRPSGTRRLALLGFGAQGCSHLRVLPELSPTLRAIRVYSRRPSVTRGRVAALKPSCDVEVFESAEEAVAGSEAVVSCTPITQPPRHDVSASELPDGSAIIAIDFDATWQLSIFDRVGLFVVDDLAQYRLFKSEHGHFAGYPTDAVELPRLLSGEVKPAAVGLRYANTLGIGLEDLAVARLIHAAASDSNAGQRLHLY